MVTAERDLYQWVTMCHLTKASVKVRFACQMTQGSEHVLCCHTYKHEEERAQSAVCVVSCAKPRYFIGSCSILHRYHSRKLDVVSLTPFHGNMFITLTTGRVGTRITRQLTEQVTVLSADLNSRAAAQVPGLEPLKPSGNYMYHHV